MTIADALPCACVLALASFGVIVLLPDVIAWVLFLFVHDDES